MVGFAFIKYPIVNKEEEEEEKDSTELLSSKNVNQK